MLLSISGVVYFIYVDSNNAYCIIYYIHKNNYGAKSDAFIHMYACKHFVYLSGARIFLKADII